MGCEWLPGGKAGKDLIQVDSLSTGVKLPGAMKAGAVWRTQEVMCVNCKVLPISDFICFISLCRHGHTVREAAVSHKRHPGLTGRPPAWLPVVLSPLCSSWPTSLHRGLVFRVTSKKQFYKL